MEFTMTQSQAGRAIEHALYLYEHFIKHNEEEEESPFIKVVVSGETYFCDGYRKIFSMSHEEFIYNNNDGDHEFISQRFGTFTLQKLAVFLSWLDENDADVYFETGGDE